MTRYVMAGLLVLALPLGGCMDLGLPGNVPIEEARQAPPPELVGAVMGTPQVESLRLILDGRLWVADGQPVSHAADAMRPIGSAAGEAVYARSWDRPPYRAVFTRLPAPADRAALGPAEALAAGSAPQWQSYAPVVGR